MTYGSLYGLRKTYVKTYTSYMDANELRTIDGASVPLTEVRDNIKTIVDEVVNTGTEYTITRHGKPVAVIIAHEEYEALVETLNILSDDDAMAAIEEAEAELGQ